MPHGYTHAPCYMLVKRVTWCHVLGVVVSTVVVGSEDVVVSPTLVVESVVVVASVV